MSIIIGGVEPFTTVDFPQRLATVLFCLGCPLRCPYCHNTELQNFKANPFISWETFLEFLETRKKLLDGVVFSGGEPLAQSGLFDAMQTVKDMGFEVGLHTSGINTKRLEQVLPLVDWVGFDVKTLFSVYEERIPCSNSKVAEQCLDILIASGVDFEARTTLDTRVISKTELLELANVLANKGVKTFAIQEYHSFPSEKNPPSMAETTAFFTDKPYLESIKQLFDNFIVRRA